jgi:hypothetical protein
MASHKKASIALQVFCFMLSFKIMNVLFFDRAINGNRQLIFPLFYTHDLSLFETKLVKPRAFQFNHRNCYAIKSSFSIFCVDF